MRRTAQRPLQRIVRGAFGVRSGDMGDSFVWGHR